MKFKVDKDACIGCGACQAICDAFDIGDDGFAYVKDEITEENKEDAIEASENCPTGAISIVDEK